MVSRERGEKKKIFIFNVSINCCSAVPNYSVYTDTKQKRAGEKKSCYAYGNKNKCFNFAFITTATHSAVQLL